MFGSALGRFAESALHFAVNADADMQGRVSLIDFAPDFNMALDVIFNNWLMSKEAKVTRVFCHAFTSACV